MTQYQQYQFRLYGPINVDVYVKSLRLLLKIFSYLLFIDNSGSVYSRKRCFLVRMGFLSTHSSHCYKFVQCDQNSVMISDCQMHKTQSLWFKVYLLTVSISAHWPRANIILDFPHLSRRRTTKSKI